MLPFQYMADGIFLRIDEKIRNENDLKGFELAEVKKVIQRRVSYIITYKN